MENEVNTDEISNKVRMRMERCINACQEPDYNIVYKAICAIMLFIWVLPIAVIGYCLTGNNDGLRTVFDQLQS